MPATMNISLPEPLKRFIDQEVRDGGFSSSSDYMRELIRERRRRNGEAKLRALIAEGLASGAAVPVDNASFASMRRKARTRRRSAP